jgi:glycosidase
MSNWWKKSVVYQVYPKSFLDSNGDGVGDLQGIISKLDYLEELGIDVIWLSPVYDSPMDDNGYDISDYLSINPLFGNMDDMKQLINAAQDHHIKIILDLVLNHTSDEHPWFIEGRKSRDSRTHDFYVWSKEPNPLVSVFSGSAWEYNEPTQEYYLHLFSKKMPDLNWKSKDLRNEITQMMNAWLDMGVAGFRFDVIEYIGKEPMSMITANGPLLHHYIKEMNQATFGNRNTLTVGECWNVDTAIAKQYSNPDGSEFSMIFQFDHMKIDWDEQLGKWKPHSLDFVKLKKVLGDWQTSMMGQGWNSLFWNNHDMPRIISRWSDDLNNPALAAKMFAVISYFMQGTPFIYQGEELGMSNARFDSLTDYVDVETINAYQDLVLDRKLLSKQDFMRAASIFGRDNVRTPMQWNDQANGGFTTGKPWLPLCTNYKEVNAALQTQDSNSVYNFYKTLIKLRKESIYSELIQNGKFILLEAQHKHLFVYKRKDESKCLLIIANYSNEVIHYAVESKIIKTVISNAPISSGKDLKLQPYEAIVFEVEN